MSLYNQIMQFINTTKEQLIADMASELNQTLRIYKNVLWLVPGGSNVEIAVKVMAKLDDRLLDRLNIVVSDERYGAVGHENSNYTQLIRAGFEAKNAHFTDWLNSKSFDDTVTENNRNLEKLFNNAAYIIGFLGMGPDGHTSGILPNSVAVTDKKTYVVGYDGGQYLRITLTPFALSRMNQAFVGSYGEEKKPALLDLRDKMLPTTTQPAQILKHIPKVSIYNDQISS